jgi:RNA polymerase sigma-70 factor (sigma-E family)
VTSSGVGGYVEFEAFVSERQRALFRFAVVLCGDPVLAEELVQNVLGRAFERWHLVAAADDANAYVRRMVVNEYLGWRRRARRTTPVAQIHDDQLPGAPDHADRHADRLALTGELATLPPKQRAVLVLRFYAGLSYAEIASCTGCRESTARAHAARALAALRIHMAPRVVAASTTDKES